MNPCATEFTPVFSTAETRIASGSKRASSTRSSSLTKLNSRKVETRPESRQPNALDPENYDLMFPALSDIVATRADSSPRASAPVVKGALKENTNFFEGVGGKRDTPRHEIQATIASTACEEVSDTKHLEVITSTEGTVRHEARSEGENLVLLEPTVYNPPSRREKSSLVNNASPSPRPVSAFPASEPGPTGGVFLPSPQTSIEVPTEQVINQALDLADPTDNLGHPFYPWPYIFPGHG